MQKRRSEAPELKALLAQLRSNVSAQKRLKVRAGVVAVEIIARVQQQSRLRK
jgi:hypothetical protein